MKKKTIVLPDEVFDKIKLGVQKPPSDYRIFTGPIFEFFKAAEDSIRQGEKERKNE